MRYSHTSLADTEIKGTAYRITYGRHDRYLMVHNRVNQSITSPLLLNPVAPVGHPSPEHLWHPHPSLIFIPVRLHDRS